VVCLEHKVQVSVYGCEASLSMCLYLQMHTFGRIDGLSVPCNWCWSQHGGMSVQWAARTGFEGSTAHYMYVCSMWRPWTYIVFYNSIVYYIPTAGSSFITKAHHWTILWAGMIQLNIFINFFLILHCVAYCRHIHPIIIIIHKDLGSDPQCFPQSVQYIFLLAFQQ